MALTAHIEARDVPDDRTGVTLEGRIRPADVRAAAIIAPTSFAIALVLVWWGVALLPRFSGNWLFAIAIGALALVFAHAGWRAAKLLVRPRERISSSSGKRT